MKKKKLIYVTIVATIIIFAFNNIVLAKYHDNYNGETKAKVAIPVLEVLKENDTNKVITENTGVELVINVLNYDDTNISEVGQNYYIRFYSTDVDISEFNITATMNGKAVQINKGITEKKFIQANQKEIHKYNIKITSNCTETTKGTIKAQIISEQALPQ